MEILFYFGKMTPFLRRLLLILKKPVNPVSNQHSRKTFFAKLLGFIAVAGVAPKLLAKSTVSPEVAPVPPAAPFKVSADSRTVARSGDAA